MVRRGRQNRENLKGLTDTICVLKAELRAMEKQNTSLKNELSNIVKPVRPRKPHKELASLRKASGEEFRREFIKRFKPKEGLMEIIMDQKFKRVVLESPFAGEFDKNIAYARACVADCLKRGEAPLASHLLYTQPGILDDTKPDERKLGIEAGFTWNVLADRVVVYTDRGISSGMKAGIALAEGNGIPVEYRKLEGYRAD